ncbi:twin-arginine translocase subunit TatC [Thioalkalicoccus limnaeus]|uniref:Sec-independent protein translocase protein TatC n=1 Tax=Thioalkalicoccus limnaeus TaxID=120681 RepID=A0ABV4BC97_9GAMM
MSSPTNPNDPGAEQPFISHLIEMRDRLIRMVIAVVVVFLLLFPFANDIYGFVSAPIIAKLPDGASMIATQVASPFLTPFKLALVSAIFVAMPYLLYQLWAFVAPGLYQHERRLAIPLLISSILLFYLGMLFAYFVVFPLIFAFFAAVTPTGVTQMPDIAFYLDFVLKLFFAFGFAFEIPIATILLVAIGATTPEQLVRYRPYVIVGAFVIGMLLTPPDVISQTLLAIPVWLLYELGIIFSRFVRRHRNVSEVDGDPEPASPEVMARGASAASETVVGRELAGSEFHAPGRFEPMTDEQMEAELDAIEAEELARKRAEKVAGKLREVQDLRLSGGDRRQIRTLLYEVLIDGDADQRRVAQNILDQLDRL